MFTSTFFLQILVTVSFIRATIEKINTECVVTKYEDIPSTLKICDNVVIDSVIVPAKKQLELELRSGVTLTFRGNTSFEQNYWQGPLVTISGSNFTIRGEEGSVLDGNGPFYWNGKGNWGKPIKPKFVKINAANATMENIKIRNCPIACVMIRGSDNLIIRNWTLDLLDGDEGVAPPNKFGHNTDGFTIAGTNNLLIENTKVFNQDDCVVITSGENVTIRNIFCHGSHGLSINGLGETLKHVLITDSIITNAENGIHVKTHLGSPPGLIQNVTYKNILILDSKYYGINIQQNYQSLPAGEPMDLPPDNHVKIHDLNLINVYGNAQNGAVPVYVLCADEGCFDWKWEGVQIWAAKKDNCTGYVPEGYSC